MRRWNFNGRAFGLMLLLGCIGTLQAATYNLSLGQFPNCSTSWSVTGSVYRCSSNGRVTLGYGDVVLANSPATLIASNGFNLRDATIGSTTNPIKVQSYYGDIDANGATLEGDLEADSGDIDLIGTSVTGSVQTGGDIDLRGGLVTGDVTSNNNRVTIDGTLVQGDITARGDIELTDSEVAGKVTSLSNRITATDSDLLGGAEANGDIRLSGGTLTGDFTSTNNRLYLDQVTMTSGNLNGGTIRITESNLGGATGVVNANAYYGSIELINSSVVYGDLTAPSWSEIEVSDDSQVFGTCTPESPGCINRPPLTCPLATGLEGDYFNNANLTAPSAFSRTDSQINFNWSYGTPDIFTLGLDNFSVRWNGYLRAPTSDPFSIAVRSDDGARLSVDSFLIIDEWTNRSATLDQVELNLTADRYYRLELEYYEASGAASVELLWDITNDGRTNFTPIPAQYLVHCTALLPTPRVEWRMDEPAWFGSAGEVKDSSGNGNNGTGGGNISTQPGFLCRGGEFDGLNNHIESSSLYGALRGNASLSFWIRTTERGNNTPYLAPGISGVEQSGGTDDIFWGWLDRNGHIGLAVGNGNSGKSKQSINDGDFHHVVLIRDADTGDYRIYIDGELDRAGRQASGRIGTDFKSLGRIENTDGAATYFQGMLDEVMVFEQLLSTGDVQLLYDLQSQGKNLNGTERDLSDCDAEPEIHHFELERNRATGLTCEPLGVTVRACLDATCSSEYEGSFNITLNANGPPNRNVSGNNLSSSDNLSLWLPDVGNYTLSVASSTPAPAEPSDLSCWYGGEEQNNCIVQMRDAGLRFFNSSNANNSLTAIDLVAGSTGQFSVQAVQTNEITGVCEGIFADGDKLTFSAGTECTDPETCLVGERVELWQNNAVAKKLPNPEDKNGGAERTDVQLTFGANSTASFKLMAPDVGLQPLTLQHSWQDPSDPSADPKLIQQAIPLRVRPASLRLVNITGSRGALDELATDAAFEIAGTPFALMLEGLDGSDPQQTTASFGRTSHPSVTWNATLNEPTGGHLGDITASTAGVDWKEGDTPNRIATEDGLSYSEVGAIELTGVIADYLPVGGAPKVSVSSDTRVIGRFVPQRLEVTQSGAAQWGSNAYIYQDQPAVFSGLQLNVDAFGSADNKLANYDGNLFKLNLAQADLLQRITTQNTTGAELSFNVNNLTWSRPTGNTDFNAATPVRLSLGNINLTWPRRTGAPTAADVPTNVNTLRLPASVLTDSDGACFDSDPSDGPNNCADLNISIPLVSLIYDRLNADQSATGTNTQVILPVWVETLTAVNPITLEPTFAPFSNDNQTGNSQLTGLNVDGLCRDNTNTTTADCTNVAASAAGNLTGLTNGQGYFTVTGDGSIEMAGVRAQVPNWLSWNWDANSSTNENGPASMLYFGQYTGRPPLLFQGPGFR